MAHFDRADHGVYEPGEDIRVFDGSEEEEDAEGSRLPLLIVLALLVLAMFGGVVWLAYTQGVARGRTETPVLTAQNGPARVAPASSGAEQPYKGFKIYEQPAPPDEDTDTATAASPAQAAPAAPSLKPAVVSAPPTVKPVQAPAAAQKLAVTTPAPPKTAAKPPAVATARNLPPAVPARSPALPAAKPAPAAVPVTGAYVLQVGAYKSQAEADTAWKAYKARHTALLADANDDIQQADLGEKGIWYRLRITGFASKDVANAMCDRLKADGGACFLGR
jgi:cell division septation protein DedD